MNLGHLLIDVMLLLFCLVYVIAAVLKVATTHPTLCYKSPIGIIKYLRRKIEGKALILLYKQVTEGYLY